MAPPNERQRWILEGGSGVYDRLHDSHPTVLTDISAVSWSQERSSFNLPL